jgi:hypothetical protein
MRKTVSSCQEAELANADEAVRQHVLDIAPQELFYRERHRSLLVAMRIIFPAKGNAISVKGQQAMIADRDSVGVPAQITKHLSRTAESRFSVNNPILPKTECEGRRRMPWDVRAADWGRGTEAACGETRVLVQRRTCLERPVRAL